MTSRSRGTISVAAVRVRLDPFSRPRSGHPTRRVGGRLMALLMSKYLHYDFGNPDDPRNDHLIFSKGHASPLLYAMFKAAGAISDDEMLTFRRFGSRIEGHPTPVLPWVDVATGSLGQGLPISVGVGLAGKRLDRLAIPRLVCLCGDSEMAEGSMWEAFESAGFHGLDNLTAIIDVNRLGQTGPTMHEWAPAAYRRRAEAFGWKASRSTARRRRDRPGLRPRHRDTGQPTVVIARTERAMGVKAVATSSAAASTARRPGSGDRGARRDPGTSTSTLRSRGSGRAASVPDRPLTLPFVRAWHQGGDAQRSATRSSRSARRVETSWPSLRLGWQQHLRRGIRQGASGAVLPVYIAEQQMVATRVGSRCVAGSRSPPPSPPSSAARTTSSAWPR